MGPSQFSQPSNSIRCSKSLKTAFGLGAGTIEWRFSCGSKTGVEGDAEVETGVESLVRFSFFDFLRFLEPLRGHETGRGREQLLLLQKVGAIFCDLFYERINFRFDFC